jgi:Mn-dependent DtxR family transcriptional regulator
MIYRMHHLAWAGQPGGLLMADKARQHISTVAVSRRKTARSRGKVLEPSSSRVRVSPTGQRILDLLLQPMSGHDIAEHLNVTPQRVRQMIRKLLAIGKVRVGDPERILTIIARDEDPAVLLSYREERVLSCLRFGEETTAPLIAAALHMPLPDVMEYLTALNNDGFVQGVEESRKGVHWCLTEDGAGHPQYRPEAKKARPVPLPVRSDRVADLLSLLATHGPARMPELRDALCIPNASANALMQYLKRKGLIRKAAKSLTAPYVLTELGIKTQQLMHRRDNQGEAHLA